MAGRIGIESSEKSLNLAAGERGVITITLTNAGNVVDAFDITVRDLDPSWYTLTPARLSLFPKAKGVTILQIHPVLSARAEAGNYPFQVVVTSRDAADETATLPLQLTLAVSGDITAEMEPQRIVGREGTYRLVVSNASNAPRQVVLRPTDAEEKLTFKFGNPQYFPLASAKPVATFEDQTAEYNVAQSREAGQIDLNQAPPPPEWTPPSPESGQGFLTLTIPTANRLEIPLHAKRREREWFGQPISHRVEVAVTPPGVEWEAKDARKAGAELVYPPILAWMSGIPLGLRRLLAILIPLLILGLLLFLLLRPQNGTGNNSASQTQTAIALSVSQTQTAAAQAASAAQTAAAQTAIASGDSAQQTALALSAQQTAAAQTALALSPADQTATALAASGGPLRIVRFDWSSADGVLQANWEVAPTVGITVTINETPVPPVGTQTYDVNEDNSLILEATDGEDVVSRALAKIHVRPPSIVLFTSDPPAGTGVAPGTPVTLRWETLRADQVLLDGAPVESPNGSIQVTPSSTTEYLLVAESSIGTDIARVTVTISGP
jgi:hypothetical protein